MAKKEVIVELDRQDKRVSIKIKIPQELEDYFKKVSAEVKHTSARWFYNIELTKQADFYDNVDTYKAITDKLASLGLHTYNDFGDGLIRERLINIAPLRCVGVSEGITLFSENFQDNGIDFEMYVRELALVIKAIWREYISKTSVKAVITYDI